jgi:predicted N-acyltransferase
VEPSWKNLLKELGRHDWAHQSFIWKNLNFRSFDDYLALFKTNQRRNIRRERKSMEKQGLFLKIHEGDNIPEHLFSSMFDFYVRTNDKFGPWGCKYLNKDFFDGLHEFFRNRILLSAAYLKPNTENPVGMSLLVVKNETLYGRYWGSYQKYDSLHFNVCYYYPIQWAIENGIREFNPGAGGGHKVRRGFISTPSYSILNFYDPKLQNILIRNIDRINRLEQEQIDLINLRIPFARNV